MANRVYFLTFVLVYFAISNVASLFYGYKYGNGDLYKADIVYGTANGVNDKTNVNCTFLDNPCSKDSSYKICIAIYDGYMQGICFQDYKRLTQQPDEPVLTVINYATEELNETLLTRFDIPNNPLQPCKGRGDTASCKPGYFCLNSNDETMHFCAIKVY